MEDDISNLSFRINNLGREMFEKIHNKETDDLNAKLKTYKRKILYDFDVFSDNFIQELYFHFINLKFHMNESVTNLSTHKTFFKLYFCLASLNELESLEFFQKLLSKIELPMIDANKGFFDALKIEPIEFKFLNFQNFENHSFYIQNYNQNSINAHPDENETLQQCKQKTIKKSCVIC